MKKLFLQGLIIIALFFFTWFILKRVDWITLFKVEKTTEKMEEKLGELFWDVFKKTEKENKTPFVISTIDSIVAKICLKNNINDSRLKIHVLQKDDINAFALPNGHLVIYSGLILASGNPEELSGVIGHEIAHIELNHVMKKLVREVGFSVLISMTAGGSSTAAVKQTAKMLSSSAFDRSLEKAADLKAVKYLIGANIDPESFANFLYRLADNESETMHNLSWMSTHPDSKERVKYIVEHSRGKTLKHEQVLAPETWDKLQEILQER